MAETLKLRIGDPHVRKLVRAAFPTYRGRKVRATFAESVTLYDTFWSGGTRSSYVLVDYDNAKLGRLPHYAPPQFGGPATPPVVTLTPGMVLVEHTIFCGKDVGITLHVHPDNAPKLLTAGA